MSNTPSSPGWGLHASPFHEGELAVQERVGVREKMAVTGRQVVREYLTGQHREFFGLLPYSFVGSVDAQGRPWASILLGHAGFLDAVDAQTVAVQARPLHGDPPTAPRPESTGPTTPPAVGSFHPPIRLFK
ncbi:hypothetical protein [Burkholderia sp. 3C]